MRFSNSDFSISGGVGGAALVGAFGSSGGVGGGERVGAFGSMGGGEAVTCLASMFPGAADVDPVGTYVSSFLDARSSRVSMLPSCVLPLSEAASSTTGSV
jgi:hypothetical protein